MNKVKVHKNFKRVNVENEHETEEMMKIFEDLIFEKVRSITVIFPREESEFEHFNKVNGIAEILPIVKTEFDHFDGSMIKFENFDRLYHISYTDGKDAYGNQMSYAFGFHLAGRMNFNGKYIFIQIVGSILKNDRLLIGSYIFLCMDANLLMKAMIKCNVCTGDIIRQSLAKDGIRVDNTSKKYWEYCLDLQYNRYPFQELYSLNSDDIKKTLKQRKNILPEYLLDKIDDFVEYYELEQFFADLHY